jgi:hypothetical protein
MVAIDTRCLGGASALPRRDLFALLALLARRIS